MMAAPKLANVVMAAARCKDLGPFSASTFVVIIPAAAAQQQHQHSSKQLILHLPTHCADVRTLSLCVRGNEDRTS